MAEKVRRLVALACIAAALTGCSVADYPVASSPQTVPVSCVAAPQNSSRIGFYATSVQQLTAAERLTTVTASWTSRFTTFGSPFPAAAACQSSEHGATPIIQINPYSISLTAISDGSRDTYLRAYADQVRIFHAPVILSFGHEMNGNWYPWGWTHAPAAAFVAAWRHIVTIFRQQRASNATWMWTVNIDSAGSRVVQPPAAWWPGARYVGLIGIDGYYRYPHDTWDTVFRRVIAQVHHISALPVLIAETGVEKDPSSYAQTMSLLQGVEQNDMIGLVWFNANGDKDWRLQDDTAALAGFRAALGSYERSAATAAAGPGVPAGPAAQPPSPQPPSIPLPAGRITG